MTRVVALGLTLALFSLSAAAQHAAYTPAPSSPERTAILNSVRQVLQEQLKQPVRFRVRHLKLQDGWGFLVAEPQRPDGRSFNYRGTPYEAAVEAGVFDETVHALLRKERSGWKIVTFELGATDVAWEPWPQQYRAPREIFPH